MDRFIHPCGPWPLLPLQKDVELKSPLPHKGRDLLCECVLEHQSPAGKDGLGELTSSNRREMELILPHPLLGPFWTPGFCLHFDCLNDKEVWGYSWKDEHLRKLLGRIHGGIWSFGEERATWLRGADGSYCGQKAPFPKRLKWSRFASATDLHIRKDKQLHVFSFAESTTLWLQQFLQLKKYCWGSGAAARKGLCHNTSVSL